MRYTTRIIGRHAGWPIKLTFAEPADVENPPAARTRDD
jgi:hypothetical protein